MLRLKDFQNLNTVKKIIEECRRWGHIKGRS